MRDSGWDQLPPDVRFAGEAPAENESPPWIAIYLNHPLTEKPSCEAGHMTAPDQCCINVRKLLSIRRRPHMTHSGLRSIPLGPPAFCERMIVSTTWGPGHEIGCASCCLRG